MTNQPDESHSLRERVDDAISWFTGSDEPAAATEPAVAENEASEVTGTSGSADPEAPKEASSQDAPQADAADAATPEDSAPENSASETWTPEDPAPADVASDDSASDDSAPEVPAPAEQTDPVAVAALINDPEAESAWQAVEAAHHPAVQPGAEPGTAPAGDFSEPTSSDESAPIASELAEPGPAEEAARPAEAAPVETAAQHVPAEAPAPATPVDTPVPAAVHAPAPVNPPAPPALVDTPAPVAEELSLAAPAAAADRDAETYDPEPVAVDASATTGYPASQATPTAYPSGAYDLSHEAETDTNGRSLFRDDTPPIADAAAAGVGGVTAAETTAVLDPQEAARLRREERAARDRQLGKVIASDEDEPLVTAFTTPGTYKGLPSFGLFVFRLIVAAVVGIRAYQHVTHLTATRQMWAVTVVPSPDIVAWVQIGLEIAIAVMVLLGLGTRIAGVLLVVLSAAQLAFVQWGAVNPFQPNTTDFIGVVDVVLLAAGVLLATIGGGRAGADGAMYAGRIKKKNDKLFA